MSRWPAWLHGLADSLAIAAGYVPVALSFGLMAVQAGLPAWSALLISLLIYAGASQFLLVSLLATGAKGGMVVGMVWLMNLRHLFYGPSLLEKLGSDVRRAPSGLLAAGLTDEVFATAVSRLDGIAPARREGWYLGLQLGAYLSWVGGTWIGAWFGQGWAGQSAWLAQTLGFVLPALFFALLLEIRSLVPPAVLPVAAAATLLALWPLPGHLALPVGMLAGAAVCARRN